LQREKGTWQETMTNIESSYTTHVDLIELKTQNKLLKQRINDLISEQGNLLILLQDMETKKKFYKNSLKNELSVKSSKLMTNFQFSSSSSSSTSFLETENQVIPGNNIKHDLGGDDNDDEDDDYVDDDDDDDIEEKNRHEEENEEDEEKFSDNLEQISNNIIKLNNNFIAIPDNHHTIDSNKNISQFYHKSSFLKNQDQEKSISSHNNGNSA
jgi:hypothetical protein